jgi:hypothetical protein
MIGTGVLTTVLGAAPEGVRNSRRGIVKTADGDVEAFVKVLSPMEIIVECICALVGQRLRLPVPQPLLVRVPGVHAGGTDTKLAFGSVAVPQGNFRWFFQRENAAALRRLTAWAEVERAASFDEWIANGDRHFGNILHDGRDEFWLIDHDQAIPDDFAQSGASERNWLLGVLVLNAGEDKLVQIARAVDVVAGEIAALAVAEAAQELPLAPFQPGMDQAVRRWLEGRKSHLPRLLAARVPTKQGRLFGGENA